MGIPINGYERYTVDERGRIYSLISERYLKPHIENTGYVSVELFGKNGKSKRLLVHRLVAAAFIPNPNNYTEVNHKDENPLNNAVSNLEWCDRKYNMNFGTLQERKRKSLTGFYKSERIKEIARKNGTKRSKAVLQFTKSGDFIARYNSAAEASRETQVNHSHIVECCKNEKYKSAGGFVWKYK